MNPDNIIEEDFVDRPLVELAMRGAGHRRVEARDVPSRHSAPDSIIPGKVPSSNMPKNVGNINKENSVKALKDKLEGGLDFDRIFSRGREVSRLDRMNSAERVSGEGRIINNIIGSFDSFRQKTLRASYDLGHVKIRYVSEMDIPSTSRHSPNMFPHFSLFISRNEMEKYDVTPQIKGDPFNNKYTKFMNMRYGLHSSIQKNYAMNVDDIRYYPEFHDEGIIFHRRIDYDLYK